MENRVVTSSSEDEEDVSRFASVAVDGMTLLKHAVVGPPRANDSHPSRQKSLKCSNIIIKNLEVAFEKRMDAMWANTYLWTEEEEQKAYSQHLTDQAKQSGNDAMGMKMFQGGPYVTKCDTLGDVSLDRRNSHVVRKIQRRQIDKQGRTVPFDLSCSGVVVTAEEIQQCYKRSLKISAPCIGRKSVGKAKMRRLARNARLYGHSLNCDDE